MDDQDLPGARMERERRLQRVLHVLPLDDAGDLPAARAEAVKQLPVINAIMGGGQGAVMAKEALKLLGVIPSATLRLPLVGPTLSLSFISANGFDGSRVSTSDEKLPRYTSLSVVRLFCARDVAPDPISSVPSSPISNRPWLLPRRVACPGT